MKNLAVSSPTPLFHNEFSFFPLITNLLTLHVVDVGMVIASTDSTQEGYTSLMWACVYSQTEIVVALLGAGASVGELSKVR